MEVEKMQKFDDIRPVHDSEVKEVTRQLTSNPTFKRLVKPLIKPIPWFGFTTVMHSSKSIYDFQKKIIYPFMTRIIKKTTTELSANGFEKLNKTDSYLFISNHRDIVLDAGFLNMLLIDQKFNTCEIAIGDNLLIYPWITDLVRLNKSFIVKRKVSVREMIATSKQLSEYINDTIVRRKQSIWLAQREGRAKDSNDRTQTSLLKMLTLYDSARPAEALAALNIVPLSLNYEYDPCDYLKAKEFQQKRDNPDHKKSQSDDIENMKTGIMGFKGRVIFNFGNSVNDILLSIDPAEKKSKVFETAADAIDTEIFKNYQFFPVNYIAYDMMEGKSQFTGHYTNKEKRDFEDYLDGQIYKVNLPNKDEDFLRSKIIEMYANTLKNHLSVQ